MKKVCFDNDIVQTLKENKSNHIGLWFKTWTETFRILIEIWVSTETDSKYFCYIYIEHMVELEFCRIIWKLKLKTNN